MNATRWHVYLLECDGRAIYTGITTDVARRVAEHASGGKRAARFTRGRARVRLLYATEIGERGLAMRAEHRLRRLPRATKLQIAAAAPDAQTLLGRLGLMA